MIADRKAVVGAVALLAMVATAVPASAKKPPPTAPGVGLLPIGSASPSARPNDLAINPSGDSLYAGSGHDLIDIFGRAPDGTLTPAGGASAQTSDPLSVAAGDSSVYVGTTNTSLVGFARGGDGSLTFTSCVDAPPTSPPCGSSSPGMGRGIDLALSPGGESLYAVSDSAGSDSGVDSITQFSAGPGGGLSPVTCISDNDSGSGSCPQRADGLGGAFGVAVSPDGSSVYVLASGDDAIAHFSRAADGSLSYVGCIDDNDSGADDCAQSTDGLGFPFDVAVSPDGRSVYTVSFGDEAVSRFDRAPDGSLTPAGCATHEKGADVCSIVSNESLNNPLALAVTNASVFVAANASDQIVRFARAPDGSLTAAGCAGSETGGDEAGASTPCAVKVDGLVGVDDIVASPDGTSLYTGNNAVVLAFRIDEVPPETKVKGPKRTSKSKPTFKLKSSEPGSTFLCGVDKKQPKPCGAKFKPKLGDGKHKLIAIAVDAAGNPDPTPAKKKVTVTG